MALKCQDGIDIIHPKESKLASTAVNLSAVYLNGTEPAYTS
jgi:hypothetical protein